MVPYKKDEIALVLPKMHHLATLDKLTKEDLYRLNFISLDAKSTTRKLLDQRLINSGLDLQRLRVEMELNSLEAIKNAVQSGLGVAFLPVVSIEKELSAGTVQKASVADLVVQRELKLIVHPSRYSSRAAEAFRADILPVFAGEDSPIRLVKGDQSIQAN